MCVARYDAGSYTTAVRTCCQSLDQRSHSCSHLTDDNGSDRGGGRIYKCVVPIGWIILAASSTIINDLTVRN